jgi:hypothetical protein
MIKPNDTETTVPLTAEKIPEDLAVEMRRMSHDLSNALEIIVQTSFLLGTTEMKEPASDWLRLLDSGVQKALAINLAMREYIKLNGQ